MKTRIKKDDTVIVIAGKERFSGKTGKVLRIVPGGERILVQGVNMIKRHVRPSQKNPQGGSVEKEAPLAVSNVQIYCSRCKRGTRIGIKALNDGKKIRICRRCGETLD
ncbi:MAG TPA: 50S ribosomal protein L24 [bacterium]|nr:50S ribosomal protein L24 [bacterium]HPQ65963.1 50S ribosomal protein L24 [bacterium]